MSLVSERSVRRALVLLTVVSTLAGVHSRAADPRPTMPSEISRPAFDLERWNRPPETFPAEELTADGVRSLFYEGEPYRGKPTRVFAWWGLPKIEGKKKVPAMVLIHGGGGTAFDRWVRVWTERGYAAIAMDLCGCVPVGTYGNWQRQENGGPPGWDASFATIDDPQVDQWQYHALGAIVRGHSLLRSFPEVDPERIGVTGISWGGYLTCLTAGVDHRFKFAAPVYGCGFLGENSAWLPRFEQLGPEKSARWLKLWDPAEFLPQAKMPILWVNGTNDFAYPMDSWQKSYRLAKGERTLCLRVRMPHGHGPAGENPEEIRAIADAMFRDGVPLARVQEQGRDGAEVWVTCRSRAPIVKAELNYTTDVGKWQDRKWESIRAVVDSSAARVTATLPKDVAVYYLNLFDDRDRAVSSEHVVLRDDTN